MKRAQADRCSRSLASGAARRLPISPGTGREQRVLLQRAPLGRDWDSIALPPWLPLHGALALATSPCCWLYPTCSYTASVTCHGTERSQTALVPHGAWGGHRQQGGAMRAPRWGVRNPPGHN